MFTTFIAAKPKTTGIIHAFHVAATAAAEREERLDLPDTEAALFDLSFFSFLSLLAFFSFFSFLLFFSFFSFLSGLLPTLFTAKLLSEAAVVAPPFEVREPLLEPDDLAASGQTDFIHALKG